MVFPARACRRLSEREAFCSGLVKYGQDNALNHDTKRLIRHILKTTSGCHLSVSIDKQPFSNMSIRALGVSNQQEIPIGGNSDER
jgi:hypothetical protein